MIDLREFSENVDLDEDDILMMRHYDIKYELSKSGTSMFIGDVRGKRPLKGPIIGATVILKSHDNGKLFQTKTDERGWFRFENIPYGSYTLIVEKEGCSTFKQDVEVQEMDNDGISGLSCIQLYKK